jgi:hypothetical protein
MTPRKIEATHGPFSGQTPNAPTLTMPNDSVLTVTVQYLVPGPEINVKSCKNAANEGKERRATVIRMSFLEYLRCVFSLLSLSLSREREREGKREKTMM